MKICLEYLFTRILVNPLAGPAENIFTCLNTPNILASGMALWETCGIRQAQGEQ